jgi:hypothetical protein
MSKNTYNEIDIVLLSKHLVQKFKVHKKKSYLAFSLPVVAAIAFYLLWPKQYDLVLLGSCRYLRSEALTEIGRILNTVAKEGNTALLASTLKIDYKLSAKIQRIKLNSIRPDILTQTNTPQKETYFQLIVSVSSVEQKEALQTAFINYLEQNPYVAEKKRLSQQMDKRMMEKILSEIAHLEDFRKQLLTGDRSNAKLIMIDPSKINQTIVDLNFQVTQLELNIAEKNEFNIIQDFTTPKKPSFPKLGVTLLVGIVLGLFLTLGIVLISD